MAKPKKARKCAANTGSRVGLHPRSCPKSKTLPKVRGYKPSKEKCAFLARHGIHPTACSGVVKRRKTRKAKKG